MRGLAVTFVLVFALLARVAVALEPAAGMVPSKAAVHGPPTEHAPPTLPAHGLPQSATQTDDGRLTALTATMVVKVVHVAEVRKQVLAKVKALHGHPMLMTDAELVLKVPPASLPELLELLASSGTVLGKSLQRADLTDEIAQLEARLKSKREVLQRMRGFIDDSNVQATLRIERTMTQLVQELESVKGELAVQRERARFATVQVSFQYFQHGRITYVNSPFAWLNEVDLDVFLREF